MTEVSLYLKHPSTIIICGPTQCGKTSFTCSLIKNSDSIFGSAIEEIVYCTPTQVDNEISLDRRVTWMDSVPDLSFFKDNKNRILVLDDMMTQQDQGFVDLFTRISHHNNVTVIFITQNIFSNKRGSRDMSLNAHYIVFFKNPRDKNQINFLARQIFPEHPKLMQECYQDATQNPHGYLLIDLTQTTKDDYRLRTKIFPADSPRNIFYVPIPYKKA